MDFFGKNEKILTNSHSGSMWMPQTAENMQENHEREKEEALGNNGRDPLKERTNNFGNSTIKESPSKSHMQQSTEWQSHTFSFRYKAKKYAVACDKSKTVLEALNTNKNFKKILGNHPGKEIIIQRSKCEVPRSAVATDFPCCLIEKNELLDITFIKSNGDVATKNKMRARRSFTNQSENLVKFYIKTKGGEKVKLLMKNHELRKKVEDVCVYAFKDDKLKTALRRDGRFSKVIFNKGCALFEIQSEEIHGMSDTVEHLDGKYFKIVISNNKEPESQESVSSYDSPAVNEASSPDLKEKIEPEKIPVNAKQGETQNGKAEKSTTASVRYSRLEDSGEILSLLRSQFDGLLEILKSREELKNKTQLQKFFRTEYDKSIQSFSEVYKVKQLMSLSDSVCQVRVEGSAKGTGFILFDRFILTNAHVIRNVLESQNLVSSAVRLEAAFNFEHLDSEVKLVPIKKDVPAYCYITDIDGRRLDFALLELTGVDEITGRPELLSLFRPGLPPNSGQICIVGHPDGGIKKMDPCFIIENENLKEAEEKHKSENKNFLQVITQGSLEEKWQIYQNQINYHSCFFHGSSGSPVFDEHCRLIGLHTGGYVYPGEKCKTRSVVEYAYSMQPILDMIRAQAKIKGLNEIVNKLAMSLIK